MDVGPAPNLVTKKSMIDMDAFVADCVAASGEANPQEAVREVLARGVREPRAMLRAVDEPEKAGLEVFHRSKTRALRAGILVEGQAHQTV